MPAHARRRYRRQGRRPRHLVRRRTARAQAQVVSSGTAARPMAARRHRCVRGRGHRRSEGARLDVTLSPFVLMDIPAGNTLPDPYGGTAQAAYPWRGRITVHPAPGQPGTPDKTAAAATQLAAFMGTATPAHFAIAGGGRLQRPGRMVLSPDGPALRVAREGGRRLRHLHHRL